jgi:hypothetical protein
VTNVTLSPLYLRAANPPANLDLSLLVGEIKDINVLMYKADGTPFTEDDNTYDTLTAEVRTENGRQVVEASITASLNGNVLTFRSTAAMATADRSLKLIVWGNKTVGTIHECLGSGIINVVYP